MVISATSNLELKDAILLVHSANDFTVGVGVINVWIFGNRLGNQENFKFFRAREVLKTQRDKMMENKVAHFPIKVAR